MESESAAGPSSGARAATGTPAAAKRARLRIFLITFLAFLAMIAAAAIGMAYTTDRYWESALRVEIERSLIQKTQLFASRVSTDRTSKIEDIAAQEGQHAGARATVIDGNGKVIADSQIPVAALENEGRRPEFAPALCGQTGIETRNRNGIPVLYVAVPIAGGAVRLAYPLADVEIAKAEARRVLLLSTLIAISAALAISAFAAHTVSGG